MKGIRMTDAELNAAVAKAIGFKRGPRDHRTGALRTGKGKERTWRNFARLWEDAMLAAEEFGLFSRHCAALTKTIPAGMWRVSYPKLGTRSDDGSGPRAICEAIVALHSKQIP